MGREPDQTEADQTRTQWDRSGPSTVIDNYRVLRKLGEGGMGEVYEAQQEKPVRRRVALKLIKPGMDSDRVAARFESERQALALMSHPAIARVFDAGCTSEGRPYFAMEYINGVPITTYCDDKRLTTRKRLELFIEVCHGVQHAHQKGIIHRDLKPSNVMIELLEDRGVPKIIDFGVAKAVSQPLTERTLFTEMGALIGTPEYMSPEQMEMTGIDIDTRTDVYSMGVLLYELLVGALPFDSKQLRLAGFTELCRQIREVDPSKPSTRIGTLGDESVDCASKRHTDVVALTRQLRGDLDWIVMKAMDKDRSRRYETANGLALDIQRHLNDEPVRARPPSTSYRISKFVRRHKAGVAAATLAVVALVAGATAAGLGLVRARRAEGISRTAEESARNEAETSRQVSDFLVGMFEGMDPREAGGGMTAKALLDKGAESIQQELADQPEVQARLMHSMGTVYRSLGFYRESRPLLEQALAAREEVLGPESLAVAETLNELGYLLWLMNDYESARPLHERALAIREQALGSDDLDVAMSLNNLANVVADSGDYAGSRPIYLRSLAIREKALGREHPEVAASLNNLASVFQYLGAVDEARPLYERALAIDEEALGPDHAFVAIDLDNLGSLLMEIGELNEARSLQERALAIREKALGPDHPEVATNLNNLGTLHARLGEFDTARRYVERAHEIFLAVLGPEHADVAMSLTNLASVAHKTGDTAGALQLYERAGETYEKVLGRDHPTSVMNQLNIALTLDALGRHKEALPLYAHALPVCEETMGLDDQRIADVRKGLAEALRRAGRAEDAAWLEALPLPAAMPE